MRIDIAAAAGCLKEWDNIVILSHQKPDGDTLGSAFALLYALGRMGKRARVECADGFPARYRFIYGDYGPAQFVEEHVVTVDVAGPQLLGHLYEKYVGRIDLCIDHHVSNDLPAARTLLDTDAPAAAQIVLEVVRALGVTVDKQIANAIFTGLATDTGCFKYENVTPATHRAAAAMIEAGAQHGLINKLMFDTLSKGRLEVDTRVMETLEYHFNDRCAIITIAAGLPQKHGVTEEEMDGISAKPRKIEGVLVGVTIRDKGDGGYRFSVRTGGGVDASRICMEFGGGGHKNAAGCTLTGTLDEVKAGMLACIGRELERITTA